MDRMFSFIPKNEQGVVLLFGRYYDLLGFEGIGHVGIGCPDCIAIKGGSPVKVEFEFRSKNFILHGHDPRNVDLVVCWEKNGDLDVPVLELRSLLEGFYQKPTFSFRVELKPKTERLLSASGPIRDFGDDRVFFPDELKKRRRWYPRFAVLLCLEHDDLTTVTDLTFQVDRNRPHRVISAVSNLYRNGFLARGQRGRYGITDNGKQLLKKLLEKHKQGNL